uniref:olfactory receptor 13H1-like n=1 Tax=Jaculus jaculus TaxID=51337 RepID=UPI001E1B2B67|nr:olfactory receptor 13H1-like [Jaculus jaculus]
MDEGLLQEHRQLKEPLKTVLCSCLDASGKLMCSGPRVTRNYSWLLKRDPLRHAVITAVKQCISPPKSTTPKSDNNSDEEGPEDQPMADLSSLEKAIEEIRKKITPDSPMPTPFICPYHLIHFHGIALWIENMNYQEIENHTKVTEFILVGLSKHPISQKVLFWALMFLYIVTVAGNSLIIFLVGGNSQLHTPMYFFLGNLSLLDLLFSTSSVPLIMANALQNFSTISYNSCFAQLAIRAFLALAECFLLAIMAYDRFVAISNPLRYNLVMSSRVCIFMALVAWMTALLLTLLPILFLPISFCGHNAVNHFSCEVQAIFKLLCSNTISLEIMMMACAVVSMPVPLIFILISYLCILRTVLRIHPSEARLKAFSTCGSHLIVATIYFGTLIYIYVRPQNKKSHDEDKIVSIFYAAVTPMLNPLIYTLRNKDVKAALKRVACRAKS